MIKSRIWVPCLKSFPIPTSSCSVRGLISMRTDQYLIWALPVFEIWKSKWFWVVDLSLISSIISKHAHFSVLISHSNFSSVNCVLKFCVYFSIEVVFSKKMTCKNPSRKNSTFYLLMLQNFPSLLFSSFFLLYYYYLLFFIGKYTFF